MIYQNELIRSAIDNLNTKSLLPGPVTLGVPRGLTPRYVRSRSTTLYIGWRSDRLKRRAWLHASWMAWARTCWILPPGATADKRNQYRCRAPASRFTKGLLMPVLPGDCRLVQ